jgi:hypothetical protein
MDPRQREPATNEADNRSDQKAQTEKVDWKDGRKHGGVLVNPVLEIHAFSYTLNLGRLSFDLTSSIFFEVPPVCGSFFY